MTISRSTQFVVVTGAIATIVAVLGATAPDALGENVAVASDGTVTVVWGVHYRRIEPDGTPEAMIHSLLAPGESEEPVSEGYPQIAVAPDGTATVVWNRDGPVGTTILERRIGPDGEPVGGVNELAKSYEPHRGPQVAVAPDGAAIAVWTSSTGSNLFIQGRRIAPDGTPDATVTDISPSNSSGPQIAFAPDGTATVGWVHLGEPGVQLQERRIAPNGILGEVTRDVSASGETTGDWNLAVAPDGAVTFVWGRLEPPEHTIAEERRIEPDGVPEAMIHELSAAGENTIFLAVGVAPDGTVTVAWTRFPMAALQERKIAPDGTPEIPTYDLAPEGQAGAPHLAIAPDGSATVAWDSGWEAFEHRIAPDGVPEGNAENLLISNGVLSMVGLVIAPDGAATAVWNRYLGYYKISDIIQARRFTPDGGPDPITYDVTNRGTEPATWAEPASADLGSVPIGSQKSQVFDFHNRSTDPMPISSISLEGRDADQFRITDASSCTSKPIGFVSSCMITVAFTPTAEGPMRAQLAVAANAPREPQVVPLSGTGSTSASSPCCKVKSPPPVASRLLEVGKPRAGRRKGTLSLPVQIPEPGLLTVSSTCLATHWSFTNSRPSFATPVAAGGVTVPVTADGPCKRELDQTGVVRLRLRVTYFPQGGTPIRRLRSLVLRGQLRG